jgi:hypothetical protein
MNFGLFKTFIYKNDNLIYGKARNQFLGIFWYVIFYPRSEFFRYSNATKPGLDCYVGNYTHYYRHSNHKGRIKKTLKKKIPSVLGEN